MEIASVRSRAVCTASQRGEIDKRKKKKGGGGERERRMGTNPSDISVPTVGNFETACCTANGCNFVVRAFYVHTMRAIDGGVGGGGKYFFFFF